METFGNIISGAVNVQGTSSNKYFTKAVLTYAGSIINLYAYAGSTFEGNGYARMALYRLSPGSNLIADTGSVLLNSPSWKTFSFETPIAAEAGSYALAIHGQSGVYLYSEYVSGMGTLKSGAWPDFESSISDGESAFIIPWKFGMYATYEPSTGSTYYSLTTVVDPENGGEITPSGITYQSGTITLTAKPSKEYQFDHWEGALTGSENPTDFTITTDSIISGIFSLVEKGSLPGDKTGNSLIGNYDPPITGVTKVYTTLRIG